MLHKGNAAGSSPKEEWARVSCILVRRLMLSQGLEDDQQLHLLLSRLVRIKRRGRSSKRCRS